MEFEIIFAITVLLTMVALWFMLKGPFDLCSLYNIFIVVWLYYAICVPLDLSLGLNIRVDGNFPNLNLPYYYPAVLKIFLFYLTCLIAFLFSYNVLNCHTISPEWRNYNIVLPPVWAVVIIIIIAVYIHVKVFGDLSREEQALLAGFDLHEKLITVFLTIVKAFCVIYILQSHSKLKAFIVMLFSFLFSVSAGGRTWIVIYSLVYMLRFVKKLSRIQIAVFGISFLLFAFTWKSIWANLFYAYIAKSQVSPLFGFYDPHDLLSFSFSQFEGIGPYEIGVALFEQAHAAALIGKSYVVTTFLMLWPRFLSDQRVLTLAESYGWIFRPTATAAGSGMGFSAMGEAWLNFSYLGPIFVGILWGFVARYFDKKPKGLQFVLVAVIIMRFFRSDFASVVKSYLVMFGGCSALVLGLLHVGWLLKKRRTERSFLWVSRRRQLPATSSSDRWTILPQ